MSGAASIPTPVANALSERAFQGQVLDLARQAGWRTAHWHDSRREVRPGVHVGDRDAAGFPDIVLARPETGELLICELKAERGRLTDAQRGWLQALEMCGVEVHLWKPSDWPAIVERLARRSVVTTSQRGYRACKRLMIGSGSDTYDPICDLPDGHQGACRSAAAIDQHRLDWICVGCGATTGRYDNGEACGPCVMASFAEED